MSTSLAVSFPWHRYHATPWGRHVNEAAVEWPPSPWRLLRSLYATWRARALHLEADVVLSLLDELCALPTYHLPRSEVGHTRHYLPDGRRDPQQIQGREGTDKALDAFVAVERGGELVATWPVELDAERRVALGELAASLPYLGRSESLCEARLLADAAAADAARHRLLRPAAERSASVRLLAARCPLDVEALTVRTADMRRAGYLRPPASYWADYVEDAGSPATPPPRGRARAEPATMLRWALDGPALPSVISTVAVADTLRSAAQSQYGKPDGSRRSALLAGKSADGTRLKGHRHAHYLPTDADGDGLLDELYLWCPDGLDAAEVAACARIRTLMSGSPQAGFQPLRTVLLAVGEPEGVAPALCGPAVTWVSVTPFAPARHDKKLGWVEHQRRQVDEELRHRGLPPAVDVQPIAGRPPWLAFRRYRLKERLADARRASGLRISFAEPVVGPLALGALSHFGLGLFRPAR